DVTEPIRLVIDWRAKRWRLDLFLRWRVIKRAVDDFLARLREYRHLGVSDVLGLPLRIEDEPILWQLFGFDIFLRGLYPNVQPGLTITLFRADFFKRHLADAAGHDWHVRPSVDQSIIRLTGMPRLAIGTNPDSVFDYDFAHGRVWPDARLGRQIKIFAGKKALQLDRFVGLDGAVHRPHTGLHVFYRGSYERIGVFFTGSSRFLFRFSESTSP